MESDLFILTKDFYSLKTEYEVNMKAIQQELKQIRQDNEKMRRGFNELRDFVEEKK